MSLLGARRSHPVAPPSDLSIAAEPTRGGTQGCAAPIDAAERAYCCSGHPVARVVLPARPERPEQEIFLCAHHLRACARRLSELGTSIYDNAGLPIARPAEFFTSAH
jgi:hypothetical protein